MLLSQLQIQLKGKRVNKQTGIVIDENKPFSQSLFWQGQRAFYHEKGIEAWAGEVPFYITSNPFIGNSYAKIVLRFLQDWTKKHPDSVNHPFYIIELGAGSGQFSFYVLNVLSKLLKTFNLEHLAVHYIITDFTENNIKFWQQHERLKPFVKSKLVDFALFDIEKDETITTINHQFKLTPNSSHNPVMVFANYLFDSIINDIFEVKNGTISESLVTLSTTEKNVENNTPKDWQKVKIDHKQQSITDNHYSDHLLNQTLDAYKQDLEDSYMLFPTGCLKGLQNLKKIANDKLLLVSSDKGYTTTFELDEQDFPELDFHGSFSLMVNFHAIERFFKLSNGDAFIQSPRDGLTTCVFSSGFKLDELTETSYLLKSSVEGFSPSDFFNFYELIDTIHDEAELKLLASTLCLSHWDPFIFEQIGERLAELFDEENTEIIDYVVDNIPSIVDNFYFVPGCDDIFFSLGLMMYAIDHYDEAIKYYKMSEKYFKPEFEILYNHGLSYYYSKNYKQAIDYLTQAGALKPKDREIQNLLRSSKQMQTQGSSDEE